MSKADPAIHEAIREAVFQSHQSDAVAEKLSRWFDEIIAGNEQITDEDAVYRRLDTLFSSMSIPLEGED